MATRRYSLQKTLCYAVTLTVLFLVVLSTYYGHKSPSVKFMKFENPKKSSNFLIHTPGCSIPDFRVDDPSIVKFILNEPMNFSCSGLPPLTYVADYTLFINESNIPYYQHLVAGNFFCCYSGIRRVEQSPDFYDRNCDRKWKLTDNCTAVTGLSVSNIEEDGILVLCYSTSDATETEEPFHRDIHTFIQPRRAKEKRKSFMEQGGWTDEDETLSFLIVGNDAVSRLNMRRNMPKTFKYLTNDMDAIDFHGYNKVHDSTNPNMVAVLMGMSKREHMNHSCGHRPDNSISKFDDCPLIWKDFSNEGFVTAYVEDAPNIGMFHTAGIGFVKEPTDYYNRPYFQVSDDLIGHSNGKTFYGQQCQGSRSSLNIIQNYAFDFIKMFQDVPYFGLFWTTAITHDDLEYASIADEPNYQQLKKWNDMNLLNRTILLFMSDHGQRWGDIRSTYIGMMEERLPYVMMVFPKWFKNKYSNTWQILKQNSRRLVTNYDLHLTMKDVLNKGFRTSSNPVSEYGHGQSLFTEISGDRTCADARIPEYYCTCQTTELLDTSEATVQDVATFAVDMMNKGLENFEICSELKLNKVLYAHKGTIPESIRPDGHTLLMELYSITFTTLPGDRQFDVTVRTEAQHMELWSNVTRTHVVAADSECITDELYGMYCHCPERHNNEIVT